VALTGIGIAFLLLSPVGLKINKDQSCHVELLKLIGSNFDQLKVYEEGPKNSKSLDYTTVIFFEDGTCLVIHAHLSPR